MKIKFKLYLGGVLSFFTLLLIKNIYSSYLLFINGQILNDTTLIPKLFICLFSVIGIPIFLSGLKDLYFRSRIISCGKELCGVVLEHKETGMIYDNKPYYYALVLLKDDLSNFIVLKDEIGLEKDKYPIGTYLKVKYYKNNIVILDIVKDDSSVSLELKEYLSENYPYINNPNVILINGEYYVRED